MQRFRLGVSLGKKLKKSSVLTFLAGGEMLSASSSSDLTDSIKENFFFNLIQELQFTLIACKPTNVPVKITNTCKIIDV